MASMRTALTLALCLDASTAIAQNYPSGPLRMAAMLKQPVYFMAGIYLGGNRYRVHFELLEDFSTVGRAQREAAMQSLLDKYVAALERHCRAYPYNWFNFYDFWDES